MKSKSDRENEITRLVFERDKARMVLVAAQDQVREMTADLQSALVEHLENDHNVGVLSSEVDSLRSYHKQAHK